MSDRLSENSEGRPCVVCGNLTDTNDEIPDDKVLCILHWTNEDYSEPWEQDDDSE